MRNKILSTLTAIVLTLSTLSVSGCQLLDREYRNRFFRAAEISNALKNGVDNYYTKEEKREREIEFYENLGKIHELSEKYE